MYLTSQEILDRLQDCIVYNSDKRSSHIDFSKLPDSIALTTLLASKIEIEVQGQAYLVNIDSGSLTIDLAPITYA